MSMESKRRRDELKERHVLFKTHFSFSLFFFFCVCVCVCCFIHSPPNALKFEWLSFSENSPNYEKLGPYILLYTILIYINK